MTRRLFSCALALALGLGMWVTPALAESGAVRDTQTEVVEITATKGSSGNSGARLPATGDEARPLMAGAVAVAGASLCALYAARRARGNTVG